MSVTSNLPLSPLASPQPSQSTFPIMDAPVAIERSPSIHPLSYAPFRSSPLATSNTRATIRRINQTGEMELDDPEEMDITHDVFLMQGISRNYGEDNENDDDDDDDDDDDEDLLNYHQSNVLPAIAAEGLFRAGTPTPVITPPFPQITVPALPGVHDSTSGGHVPLANLPHTMDVSGMEGLDAMPLMTSDNMLEGAMDEELGVGDDLAEITHEISTEELDTEFLDVRRRNFWNCWLRYRYRRQQQDGIFNTHVGSEWADLLAFLIENRPSEVTEEEHDNGADIQGLQWGIGDIPDREDFREKRVKDYGSLIVKPPPQPVSKNPAHDPCRIHNFYKFRYTNLKHRCSLHHFQLRYLLSATSKNDVYYICDNSLRRWDSIARTSDQIINFKQSRQLPWKGWMPSTLSCRYEIAAVGGYSGEYAIVPLSHNLEPSMRIGSLASTHFITNHVDIIKPRSGGVSVIWANNDHKVREQDVETGQFVRVHELNWPINATATSPDGRIRAAVGDAKEVVLMDAARGDIVKELWGHNHWSFAVDWRNDGHTFVTGNQDMSARLWDARYMSDSFLTLPAKMGAIRSVHFSPDGKYLAIAEPADYVHIYDASTGLYEDKQTIEYIGETAGVSFDPSGESLFIGNADDLVGSIYEFGRVRGKESDTSWDDIFL